VRVFFCLRDSQLRLPRAGEHLPQGIIHISFFKKRLHPLESFVVAGHAEIAQIELIHLMLREISLRERHRKLAWSVCAKIKKYYHIPFLNGSDSPSVSVRAANRQ